MCICWPYNVTRINPFNFQNFVEEYANEAGTGYRQL